jgi:hypothetical protein
MILSVSLVLALGALVGAQESSGDYQNPLLAKVLLYTYTDGYASPHVSVNSANMLQIPTRLDPHGYSATASLGSILQHLL